MDNLTTVENEYLKDSLIAKWHILPNWTIRFPSKNLWLKYNSQKITTIKNDIT